MFPPRERRCAEVEALKGAQQVEAAALGFGFRMNDLRQLAGERYFPTNRPQVVFVPGVLIMMEKPEEEEGLKAGHVTKHKNLMT